MNNQLFQVKILYMMDSIPQKFNACIIKEISQPIFVHAFNVYYHYVHNVQMFGECLKYCLQRYCLRNQFLCQKLF
ncbi:unnamed protein product [Paramecium sonneborni]|uniref:Uncharacterized protein n=1 Tax=Paramecium sonneborni TaxID=65129 RepID=A0A8S1RUJ8_9CILI|nr:unnamed protein product [Paramecium sonneborni]